MTDVRRLVVIPAAVLGVVLGLGAYTFIYAKGYSYLTNDPAACANCHIMREQFDGWAKSSHRSVAVCNDCHTPHGLIPKYLTKAQNGFWHSFYFTTGRYPDPLQITLRNHRITERACRSCHEELTASIDAAGGTPHGEGLSCVRCHASVGHLR